MRRLIVILGISLLLGFARLADACAWEVRRANRNTEFRVSRELTPSPGIPRSVSDYLNDRATSSLAKDLEVAMALAHEVWGAHLSEWRGLRLRVLRGDEGGKARESGEEEQLLATTLSGSPEMPVLTLYLPLGASDSDLFRLRNSLHYGVGLAAFSIYASRMQLTELFPSSPLASEGRLRRSEIEAELDRTREAREEAIRSATVVPITDAAKLVAHGFALESASRAGLNTWILVLLSRSPLKAGAAKFVRSVERNTGAARVAVLMQWGDRLLHQCLLFRTVNPQVVTLEISDVNEDARALVRRAGRQGADPALTVDAKDALRRYRGALQEDAEHALMKSREALDSTLAAFPQLFDETD